jgi:hypothetical protein
MKKLKCMFLLVTIGILLCSGFSLAETEKKDFDFFLILTQQDLEMDWWYEIPSQFGPQTSPISEVSKEEIFNIIPIFSNYGITSGNESAISYDMEIIKPDGTVDESLKDLTGYKGPLRFENPGQASYLLPSLDKIGVSFDPEDPYGEYTVNVTAYDHIKNQKVIRSQKLTLKQFEIDAMKNSSMMDWYFTYPVHPRPSLALSAFLNPPMPYIDNNGKPLWSALWLFKYIFSENEFLMSHTVEFYKTKATKQQQKDIILLFHLLNKIDALPINDELKKYSTGLKKINFPDPYQEITSGDQLDMLWAEFFATSRVKPIRRILTALNLSPNAGMLDKLKSGKLQKSDEVIKQATLDAVFQSAIWSIKSNCKQSPLLFQYCVGLYESDKLNKTEKGFLGAILNDVSENKHKWIEPNTVSNR